MNKDRYAILVVDDEESIRRLLQKELAAPGREIHVAADGAEALAQLRSHWFDVVIMDLWLPDVSDLSLLIRTRESIPNVEVIMITGHGDVDIAVEAMKLGAYDFIRKPFNLDRLDLMVELLQDISNTLKHGVPQKAARRATAPRAEKQYGSTLDTQNEAQRPAGAEISGHYDEAEVMATIRRMREEQRDRGFRYDNKAIAQALNEAGLLQSNGRPWNNDRINTVITRRMPDLK